MNVPEPLNSIMVLNAIAGLVIEGLLGVFAFAWGVEKLLSAIYRKMQCTEAFLAFLMARRRTK